MTQNRRNVPNGYIPIPISEDFRTNALKVCVLVKIEPDPVGAVPILLRERLNARVYLGCILDGAEQVHDWLELWVQNAASLLGAPTEYPGLLCNGILDERWRREAAALGRLKGASLVVTGWESAHPPPTLLDVGSRSPLHPRDPDTGAIWQLCRDEGLLQQKGLPGYGSSLDRYLYLAALGGRSPLIPVTHNAPTNDCTQNLSDILEKGRQLIDFNQQAGLIQIREHLPFAFEAFVDALGGAPPEDMHEGQTAVFTERDADTDDAPAVDAVSRNGFLLGSRGTQGRLLEAFYLKLKLLLDMTRSIHDIVRDLQQPLLNISHESFRIRMTDAGNALPWFWRTGVGLVDPGQAVGFNVEKGQERYYVSPSPKTTSVYYPMCVSVRQEGRSQVRIRKILTDSDDRVSMEGTFVCQERLDVTQSDLVLMHMNLASRRLNAYAHLETDSALAVGEWRFRTVPQSEGSAETSPLRSAEGTRLLDVPYEVIPLLTTPCDLYSLAILFVRTLLVDRSTSLPMAVDEVFSLARETLSTCDSPDDLGAHIGTLLLSDDKWLRSLGPQRLLLEEVSPEDALSSVPPGLWWAALAMIVCMFPGLGAGSDCRDYGAAPQGGLHRVFEPTVARLDDLVRHTHRLILPDPTADAVIARVIRRRLSQLETRAKE